MRPEERQQTVAGPAAMGRFRSPAWVEGSGQSLQLGSEEQEAGARPARHCCKGLEKRAWARGASSGDI